MSRVLVDRELLERTVKHLEWDGDGSQTVMQYAQQGDRLAEELAEAIAQPAEAEGVDIIGYMDGDYRRDQPSIYIPHVRIVKSCAKGEALMTVTQHLAALSAVTAERDGLAAARMAYASEFAPDENGDPDVGNVHANIRALKAERDRLQQFESAYNEWHDKTEWVQKTAEAHELGKHRADVLKDRVDQLRAEVERLRNELAGKPLVC